jgi:hypothetical protein
MLQFTLLFLSFMYAPYMYYPNVNVIVMSRIRPVYLESNITSLEQDLEPPLGGELKLMTSFSTENWAHKWIIHIVNEGQEYDDHYYLDYFTMKGMTNMYTSSEYFYLGFFPESIIASYGQYGMNKYGPKYIGLFYLDHKKRIFNTKCIIENPHFMNEDSELDVFKRYIINLTDSAYVFFNYKELDRPGQVRYYLEWKFN